MAALAPEALRAQPGASLEVAKHFEPRASPTISRAARIQSVMGAHANSVSANTAERVGFRDVSELKVPDGGQGYAWVDCDTGNLLP